MAVYCFVRVVSYYESSQPKKDRLKKKREVLRSRKLALVRFCRVHQTLAVIHNMKLKELYALSSRFAPPEIDLRKARVIDDYGCDDYAKVPINHEKPGDVKREELDYYGWVYPFMNAKDLLFYLYAVVRECQKDISPDWLDSYMYSMDRALNKLMGTLSEQERRIVRDAFKIIWDAGGENDADWWQCKHLQQLIGITIS